MEVFHSLIRFICDKLIDYKGEKPSTQLLVRKRIQRFYTNFIKDANHSTEFNGVQIVRLDKIEKFCLELFSLLKALDYFLKMQDLEQLLLSLHMLPIKVERLGAADRVRAENLIHFIKEIQRYARLNRGMHITDIETMLAFNSIEGFPLDSNDGIALDEGKSRVI